MQFLSIPILWNLTRIILQYLELTSGLRRGELLALLWKDLNVKERTLSVTKSVCRIDH